MLPVSCRLLAGGQYRRAAFIHDVHICAIVGHYKRPYKGYTAVQLLERRSLVITQSARCCFKSIIDISKQLCASIEQEDWLDSNWSCLPLLNVSLSGCIFTVRRSLPHSLSSLPLKIHLGDRSDKN